LEQLIFSEVCTYFITSLLPRQSILFCHDNLLYSQHRLFCGRALAARRYVYGGTIKLNYYGGTNQTSVSWCWKGENTFYSYLWVGTSAINNLRLCLLLFLHAHCVLTLAAVVFVYSLIVLKFNYCLVSTGIDYLSANSLPSVQQLFAHIFQKWP